MSEATSSPAAAEGVVPSPAAAPVNVARLVERIRVNAEGALSSTDDRHVRTSLSMIADDAVAIDAALVDQRRQPREMLRRLQELAIQVERSRGPNCYARNQAAVGELVDLELSLESALAATGSASGVGELHERQEQLRLIARAAEALTLFEAQFKKLNHALHTGDLSLATFPRTGTDALIELTSRRAELQWVLEMLPQLAEFPAAMQEPQQMLPDDNTDSNSGESERTTA
ncbi:MAG: hypothetical protein K0Q43_184 [Ramlibacter sp.]|jgi:hypothetical protein|nr:hypothetical protein [Ramlibacter sp.]